MQDDCIAVALGLPQLKILRQQELESHIEVTVIYRRGEARCPRCGKVTHKEHDRRLRDKEVFPTLMKRRFRCLWFQETLKLQVQGISGKGLKKYTDSLPTLKFHLLQ